ncbi:hypothetical protein [Nocardia suismassiliense]|uniref:hypothetical protein n=1 Tax=Nocardia suismassiliense TaxID=2077092 RepID=UPI00131F222F|nr:hypothetical protein [Nocardia suismassiliense]
MFTDPDGIAMQVIFKNPLPKPAGVPSEAQAIAQAQAPSMQRVFGAESIGNLVVDKASPVGRGATVELRQEIDAVPVYGAKVAQSLAADGSLVSASGALSQQTQGKYPTGATTPPATVADTAVRALAQETKQPRGKFAVFATAAMWYDPKLAAKDGASSVAVPAYKVAIKRAGTQGDQSAQWVLFIDANNTGRVLDSWHETGAKPEGRPRR